MIAQPVKRLFLLTGLLVLSPDAFAALDLGVGAGKRWYDKTYGAKGAGSTSALQTTLSAHYSLEEFGLPLAVGPSLNLVQFDRLDRRDVGRAKAVNNQLALDGLVMFPVAVTGLDVYGRLSLLLYNQGRRMFELDSSPDGYDVRGEEDIRTTGGSINLGARYLLGAGLGLLAELSYAQAQISYENSDVTQYLVENDTLAAVAPPPKGAAAHNSQGVMLGLFARF